MRHDTEFTEYECRFCHRMKRIQKCEYENRVRKGWTPKWCGKKHMNVGRKIETAMRREQRDGIFNHLPDGGNGTTGGEELRNQG
jgi:hypothetical protein